MVSKKIIHELHGMGWFILALGFFFLAIPYIFKVSELEFTLFYTIVGIIFIKIAIIFRENLRFDKLI
jgi:hypothetical protein